MKHFFSFVAAFTLAATVVAGCSSAPTDATDESGAAVSANGGGGGGGTCIWCPPAPPQIRWTPSAIDLGNMRWGDTAGRMVRFSPAPADGDVTVEVSHNDHDVRIDSLVTWPAGASSPSQIMNNTVGPIHVAEGEQLEVNIVYNPLGANDAGVVNDIIWVHSTSWQLAAIRLHAVVTWTGGNPTLVMHSDTDSTRIKRASHVASIGNGSIEVNVANAGSQAVSLALTQTSGPALTIDSYGATSVDAGNAAMVRAFLYADDPNGPVGVFPVDFALSYGNGASAAFTVNVEIDPPDCVGKGSKPNAGGCCAGLELWNGVCDTSDDSGCGLLSAAPANHCCRHKKACESDAAVCVKDGPGEGDYFCYADGAPRACATKQQCSFDCGYGTVYTGAYCDVTDAQRDAAPGCLVTCR